MKSQVFDAHLIQNRHLQPLWGKYHKVGSFELEINSAFWHSMLCGIVSKAKHQNARGGQDTLSSEGPSKMCFTIKRSTIFKKKHVRQKKAKDNYICYLPTPRILRTATAAFYHTHLTTTVWWKGNAQEDGSQRGTRLGPIALFAYCEVPQDSPRLSYCTAAVSKDLSMCYGRQVCRVSYPTY